jgi:predicted outer membrane lipoprotein
VPPEALLGPFGVVLAAAGAVVILWREHMKADERERKIAERALAGWEAQTNATNRLAEALEQRSRDDAERRRRSD